MKPVPHGEPYAEKLHVRFDEGAGVPDNKGRPALLYTPLYSMGIATREPRVRYSAAYPTRAERILRRETKTTVAIYCGNQV